MVRARNSWLVQQKWPKCERLQHQSKLEWIFWSLKHQERPLVRGPREGDWLGLGFKVAKLFCYWWQFWQWVTVNCCAALKYNYLVKAIAGPKIRDYDSESPKSLMMPKYGGVEKCPACLKSVYPMEKVDSLWFCTSSFEVFDLVYNIAINTRRKDEGKRLKLHSWP